MGKTRAEIQKAYRERRIARDGDSYRQKEVQRVQKYYVPTCQLSNRSLHRRREQVAAAVRNHRTKKKLEGIVDSDGCSESISSGPCDSTTPAIPTSSSSPTLLKVKLPGLTPRTRPSSHRKRTSRAISRANRQIQKMKNERARLQRTCWKLRKTIMRSKKKVTPITTSPIHHHQGTPRSKTKYQLRAAGLSPRAHPSIRRKLELHNTILQEAQESIETERGTKSKLNPLTVISGKIVKKYRLAKRLKRALGLSRRVELPKRKKIALVKKQRLVDLMKERKAHVVKFLEDDENSAATPGKGDTIAVDGEKIQRRILNDYMHNLHLKYLAENPDNAISRSFFYRCRPSYIKLASFGSRQTCLCQRHQNMTLKLKTLKSLGITTMSNPDTYIHTMPDESTAEKLEEVDETTIRYSEWKRVDVLHKGKVIKRMKIVEMEKPKAEFAIIILKELKEFREHVHRVSAQYTAVRELKRSLPVNHVICHMDFAENYLCSQADEVQSAYFDKQGVTLHPSVVYYRPTQDGPLLHKSYVVTSNELSHTAASVMAFIEELIPEIRKLVPDVDCINYISDSPTSQYRNKVILHMLAEHTELFGTKASWLYLEAGHGKGPCDGVGGTAKRMADDAVKQQKAVIQDADDFFRWGSQSSTQIKYIFVDSVSCENMKDKIGKMSLKPIKGTMKVHSVIPVSKGIIAVRDTSCFCEMCFNGGNFQPHCEGWTKHSLDSELLEDHEDGQEALTAPAESGVLDEGNKLSIEPGNYITALYDDGWYLGKVKQFDPDENDYEVSFMKSVHRNDAYSFKPAENKREETIWVPQQDILCIVSAPQPHGRSGRTYKLQDADLEKVLALFNSR